MPEKRVEDVKNGALFVLSVKNGVRTRQSPIRPMRLRTVGVLSGAANYRPFMETNFGHALELPIAGVGGGMPPALFVNFFVTMSYEGAC